MKAILRSSLFALLILGGYAGFASSATTQHIPGLPTPQPPASGMTVQHIPGLPTPQPPMAR